MQIVTVQLILPIANTTGTWMDQNCRVNTGSVAEKHKLNTEEVFELN